MSSTASPPLIGRDVLYNNPLIIFFFYDVTYQMGRSHWRTLFLKFIIIGLFCFYFQYSFQNTWNLFRNIFLEILYFTITGLKFRTLFVRETFCSKNIVKFDHTFSFQKSIQFRFRTLRSYFQNGANEESL